MSEAALKMDRPGTELVVVKPRLPMPRIEGMDERKWRVLCETTFPSARTPEAIVMALDYCRARGLDVFKRPVHIVPMWNSSLGREVETVWPGINEVQITAARTGQWAGMDEPKWGRDITRDFTGSRKTREGKWETIRRTVTFPEWCAVTVWRIVGGERRAFTEPVYWLEAYSRASARSELPTEMWLKRPRGQLHKVAKAASLRAAFPEEGEYVAEEMEGKEIDAGGIVIEHEPADPPHDPETGEVLPPEGVLPPEEPQKPARNWTFYAQAARDKLARCNTLADLKRARKAIDPHLEGYKVADPDGWAALVADIANKEGELRTREAEELNDSVEDIGRG